MADELDLTTGDPVASDEGGTTRRRRRRSTSSTSDKKKEGGQPSDGEVTSRFERVFERITRMLRTKGDDELADAIEEDGEAIGQGFVSLTSNIKPLRMPVIMVLNVVEPSLAFKRVGGILLGRFLFWRQSKLAQQPEQPVEYQDPDFAGEANGGVSVQ